MTPPPRHRARRLAGRPRVALAVGSTVLLAGIVTPTALAGTTSSPAPEPTKKPVAAAEQRTAQEGARIVATKEVGERTLDLTVDSPALGEQVKVRVILPKKFEAEPDRTWPVLYLLQGAHDDYTSWTRETDVESFLADKDVLTVIPTSGPTGIPTDWWNLGLGGDDYETFQVDELMELLRDRYRAGDKRAVAGVSTGGYGALAFAARHPGEFGAAASYSGIVDTTALGMPTVLGAIVARELKVPSMLWGNAWLMRSNWQAHNPGADVSRLKGTRLYVSQGSGMPGGDFGELEGALLEGTLWGQANNFVRKLNSAGVPAKTHLYKGGSHGWKYWDAEFRASWPELAAGLGLPNG